MSLTLVRILGWLVIAHGLSHAVLPMRGSLAPLAGGDWIPVALYGVSMVGFCAAGLGLLGQRPFDRVISPLLVVASGYSLVALFVLGDRGLWFGAACDVALLLTGLWRAFAGWPRHPAHHKAWHVAAVTLAFMTISYVGVAAFTFPAHRTWGSTRAELTMALPGDADPRDPPLEIQHAVTIDAPPEDVWVWLVQLGEDPASLYSHDWLERAGELLGESVDDWTVGEVMAEKALVLENRGAFVLQPLDDERTRLIVRSIASDRERPVWASAASMLGFQLPHFFMQRRMLLSIKTLAEERAAARAAEAPVRTIEITANDAMKYSVTRITAEPGEKLRIRLTSTGVMPKVAMAHNVVVLAIETDIDALLKEGAPFRENDFIPPSMMPQVIAKTPLAGPGERVQVRFTVPETPGEYPFVCTFAGHYQAGMRGILSVRPARMTAVIPPARDRL